MRRIALLFTGVALVAAAAYSGDGNIRRSAKHIPGRYVVVLNSGADTVAVADTVRTFNGARVHQSYGRGFNGLAVEMNDADAQTLARDSRVKFVEEDATINAADYTWGLDRIDQRSLPLNGTYVSNRTGVGVTVYVVDTGILAEHVDFGGRVAPGFNALSDNNGTTDCNGHGTHIAGIIAGATYGVAKAATLVPVRTLDCSGTGTISSLLAGLDWVLQDHARSATPAVVNMSLGGDASTALDNEVNQLIAAGITTVVAAGNSNVDACTVSPARVPAAITVGASTDIDERASFSNWGACVDLFAPGKGITSDSYTSATATSVASGTSESAPFVSGVAALTLELFPTASPATVTQTILGQATIDVLTSIGLNSPNRLLFSLIDTLDNTANTSQLLSDPSFDYGTTFWTADICTVVDPAGCPPADQYAVWSVPGHTGKGHASLGGGAAKDFHLTSEVVTLPNVPRAELSFYLWIITKGNKPTASDTLTVEIRNRDGVLLEILGTYSNLDANATYTQRRFDVSKYHGQSIRVSFTGTQNQGPATYFNIDDVALNVWR